MQRIEKGGFAMRDYTDLIDRFDEIPEMPMSEEILGAYLEGRLDEADSRMVSELIEGDFQLTNLEWAVRSYEGLDEDNTSGIPDLKLWNIPAILHEDSVEPHHPYMRDTPEGFPWFRELSDTDYSEGPSCDNDADETDINL